MPWRRTRKRSKAGNRDVGPATQLRPRQAASTEPPPALAHALAVAGVLAPNQEANGSSGYADLTGNDVKEGIPWSVVTGLTALRLAEGIYRTARFARSYVALRLEEYDRALG